MSTHVIVELIESRAQTNRSPVAFLDLLIFLQAMTWTQTDWDRVLYPHHGVSRSRGHQHWYPQRPLYSFLSDALENRIDDLIRRALPSHIWTCDYFRLRFLSADAYRVWYEGIQS